MRPGLPPKALFAILTSSKTKFRYLRIPRFSVSTLPAFHNATLEIADCRNVPIFLTVVLRVEFGFVPDTALPALPH
jgi:hypothetical protein